MPRHCPSHQQLNNRKVAEGEVIAVQVAVVVEVYSSSL